MNQFVLIVPKTLQVQAAFSKDRVQFLQKQINVAHQGLIAPEDQSSRPLSVFQSVKLGACWLVYENYNAPNFKASFVSDLLQREGKFFCAGHYPISQMNLNSLGELLLDEPDRLCLTLQPPFSLLGFQNLEPWGRKDNPESVLRLQVDGLGFAHIWHLEMHDAHVYGTRLHLLKVIQDMQVDELAWAARIAMSWFPLEFSGFKNIDLLKPGTTVTIRLNAQTQVLNHHVVQVNAVENWLEQFDQITPGGRNEDVRTEFYLQHASNGLDQVTRQSAALAVELQAGLTGGFDSRMVISSYLKQKIPLRLRVKGSEHHTDVIVAKMLADALNLKLRVKEKAELPPPTPDLLKAAIVRGGQWHFGQVYSHKFKTVFAGREQLESGDINILGHDGMLIRAPLHQIFRLQNYVVKDWRKTLREFFLLPRLGMINKKHRGDLEDIFTTFLDRIDRLNMSDAHKVEWIYAAEQGRRKNAGSLWSQPGIPVSPLMNIANIQLAARFPVEKMVDNFLHVKIAKSNIPEWSEIEYSSWMDLRKKRIEQQNEDAMMGASPSSVTIENQSDWRVGTGHHYYNRGLYWRQVGADLVDHAMQSSRHSQVAEIFDIAKVASDPYACADDLVFVSLLPEMTKV